MVDSAKKDHVTKPHKFHVPITLLPSRNIVIYLMPPFRVLPERTSFGTDRRIGVRFPTKAQYVIFSITRSPTQPPVQWTQRPHRGVEQPGREADHLHVVPEFISAAVPAVQHRHTCTWRPSLHSQTIVSIQSLLTLV